MFDPKLSGIAGGLGFVLSFLVGLISGVGFPWILLRALLFGAAFFALAGGAYWLVTRFLPELLEQGEEEAGLDADSPGSRVDISVTGEGAAGEPSPGMDASTGLTDLVGGASPSDENAGPLYGNGLDQKAEDGYTRKGTVDEGPVSGAPPSPQGAAVPAQEEGSSDTVDELPDLELMSDAFINPPVDGGGGELIETSSTGAGESGGSGGGKKPQNLGGDFNVKEMASAIQTILKREDKG